MYYINVKGTHDTDIYIYIFNCKCSSDLGPKPLYKNETQTKLFQNYNVKLIGIIFSSLLFSVIFTI